MLIPVRLAVKKGSTVIWRSVVELTPSAAKDPDCVRIEGVNAKDDLSFKFNEPGIYHFTCSIHPQMLLTIIVE